MRALVPHLRLAARALAVGAWCTLAVLGLAPRLLWSTFVRRRAPADTVGGTAADLAERLGPTYVKLAQILSTRGDLLPPGIARGLARLQEDLEPIPEAVARAVLERELGDRLPLDRHAPLAPIGSASIATVFRARLADGRAVAIKIRRPGIARRMHDDLRLCRLAVRGAAAVPRLAHLPLVEATNDLCACVERQLDFRREAASAASTRRALLGLPGVRVPAAVEELVTPEVIVMELHEDDKRPPDEQALLALTRALYTMIFVTGLVHCDLHPGNLRFPGDGSVVLLDFGFMSELPPRERGAFAEFFAAIATADGERAAEIILETATAVPPALDRAAFATDVGAIVGDAAGKAVGAFSITEFVLSLFAVQRRHGIRGTSAFALAIVALLVVEGTVRVHAPGLDFQGEALPFAAGTLGTADATLAEAAGDQRG